MSILFPFQLLFGVLGLVVVYSLFRSIRIIPAKSALVIERLGKYTHTLEAGFHVLIPFADRVKYTHSLKEQAIDVPSQPCFTQDNVKVEVDGVLYFKVTDPKKASYGITNYRYATIQLAQTTMRSIIGKLEMDKTFEERENINAAILRDIDEATDPWGVTITRYEIQNIRVPDNILTAMEIQLRAEREKRAVIARSVGEMESRINYSTGMMEESVNKSEGQKERFINEAEGKAAEIRAIAAATAASIEKVAKALEKDGGNEALSLKLSESYIQQLQQLAKKNTKLVLPMDLTDLGSVLNSVQYMLHKSGGETE
ncbi:SPFH domain-containing protein [Spirochaeta africana]|uniref:Membrane protease subunit, stomatin/prohibitin n=1 Tax=Spirochaeta africana (strain ATCC 700263 / DSM 8902 / Z-7692) TaxID=889378 RepID=H9UMV3_SPIAZ|nr:membrane protease subunit, stomatin/prohibitin [Spirochaeta africana DSM 8902]